MYKDAELFEDTIHSCIIYNQGSLWMAEKLRFHFSGIYVYDMC